MLTLQIGNLGNMRVMICVLLSALVVLFVADSRHRDPALLLAILLVQLFGVEWTLQGGARYLLLLVHLSCIEVRMGLEDKTYTEVSM